MATGAPSQWQSGRLVKLYSPPTRVRSRTSTVAFPLPPFAMEYTRTTLNYIYARASVCNLCLLLFCIHVWWKRV
jgi:hypothetical protein